MKAHLTADECRELTRLPREINGLLNTVAEFDSAISRLELNRRAEKVLLRNRLARLRKLSPERFNEVLQRQPKGMKP